MTEDSRRQGILTGNVKGAVECVDVEIKQFTLIDEQRVHRTLVKHHVERFVVKGQGRHIHQQPYHISQTADKCAPARMLWRT